jgi:hypothetical protein
MSANNSHNEVITPNLDEITIVTKMVRIGCPKCNTVIGESYNNNTAFQMIWTQHLQQYHMKQKKPQTRMVTEAPIETMEDAPRREQ